jgi:hypothetical protein
MEQGARWARRGGAGSPVRSGDGEVAMGDGAEEVVGVGWAPVTGNVRGELLELDRRRGKRTSTWPRRRNTRGQAHCGGGKSATTAAREAAEAWPLVRTRGREGGEGCCGVVRRENVGGENEARRRRAAPFLNGAVGSKGSEGVRGRRPRGGRRRREWGWTWWWTARAAGNSPRPAGADDAVATRTGEPGADRWAAATVAGSHWLTGGPGQRFKQF